MYLLATRCTLQWCTFHSSQPVESFKYLVVITLALLCPHRATSIPLGMAAMVFMVWALTILATDISLRLSALAVKVSSNRDRFAILQLVRTTAVR